MFLTAKSTDFELDVSPLYMTVTDKSGLRPAAVCKQV